MHLEHLTIHGFKSFAQKTTLTFIPTQQQANKGITAVVGPNGSGKSNIVDAIRWVLGEQSNKHLRGKKSEDVIFAGSGNKARGSMAEVSLKLNNEDNTIDLDYSEIELTRRLYRDGQSEYLINGKKSRLADIAYILAKAHIGQRSYTVIGQGMIDRVLSSTPVERKDFFDEAAGIKHLQIKKEQAINKLTASKDNLAQGQLQLHELTPRLKTLTRQVKRLEQREEIITQLNEALHAYYSNTWYSLQTQHTTAYDAKVELETTITQHEQQLQQLQETMQQLAAHDPTDQQAYQELLATQTKLHHEKNQLLQNRATWQGRLDSNWEQHGQHNRSTITAQIQQLKQAQSTAREALTRVYNHIKSLEQQEKNHSSLYQPLIKKIQKLKEIIFSALDATNASDTHTDIHGNIQAHITRLEKIVLDPAHAETPLKKVVEHITTILTNLKQLTTALAPRSSTTELNEARTTLEQLEKEKTTADQQLAHIKTELTIASTRVTELKTTIKHNEQALSAYDKELAVFESTTQDDTTTAITETITAINEKIIQIDTELATVATELEAVTQSEKNQKQTLFATQQESRTVQQQLNKLNQERTQHEIELARLTTKKEDLQYSAEQDFELPWDKIKQHWKKSENTLDTAAIQSLRTTIAQLKKKKELIGSIDQQTTSEYEETKQRHEFLEHHIADLTNAIDSLETIIIELEQKIQSQFISNLKKINQNFSKYFGILFNGGKAELTIVYSDELETDDETTQPEKKPQRKSIAGIDIVATPPGKKLQPISVLSGGEKALTSIALICSIIANNTSPFVVLDEVDAALDEANSARFADIIASLADHTQFIVVTHNRATMEQGHTLYGVTMGDDGISKLLSIKLAEGAQYANR